MYILDGTFFTALPSIILGIICFGILYFLIFNLISKATGKSIKMRGGFTYPSQTVADPDTLDNIGKDVRKFVDKKYRIKKQLEDEYSEELQRSVKPLENAILKIAEMCKSSYRIKQFSLDLQGSSFALEKKILSFIKKKIDYKPNPKGPGYYDRFKLSMEGEMLTSEDLEKLHTLRENLINLKEKALREIKIKYENKQGEI